MSGNDLLGYNEAAPLLGIASQTLRRLVMKKGVPHLKPFGTRGRTFFLRDDLESWLLSSRVEAAEPVGTAGKRR
jgi:excisionase family DNA binding protein